MHSAGRMWSISHGNVASTLRAQSVTNRYSQMSVEKAIFQVLDQLQR